MKKLLAALLLLFNLSCFSQASKWFVSFSVSPTIGGPSASIRKEINNQHFNQTSYFNFFGLEGSTKYPKVLKDASVLLRGGKKIDNCRGIYFVLGQANGGSVKGFKGGGYSNLLGILGATPGDNVGVDYTTYQFTGGYMYTLSHSRTKLGFGPSVYLLSYGFEENFENNGSYTAITPGVSFTTRMPLGKEEKLFGVELFFEGNAAVPVKMKGGFEKSGFKPGTLSMFSANTGMAFSIRR